MRFTKPLVSLGLLSGITPSAAQTPPGLFQALTAAGAGQFATFIQSDPALVATFTSPQVGTIFAPRDGTSPNGLRRRDTVPEQKADLSACHGIQSCAQLNQPPGVVAPTSNKQANIGGGTQNVVTKSTNSSTCGSGKRWLHGRQASGIQISGGLGNAINILQPDIPYNGGVIHLVDNYFTNPESVSNSSQALGLSTFYSLASSANLLNTLDNTPAITVFIPSDAAFAAAGLSTPSAGTAALLEGHIVPNFLGYLPNLHNGAELPTQNGTALTVSVQGNNFYINGALITTSNIITLNGVVHVIDHVLQPGTATTTTASSSVPTATTSPTGVPTVTVSGGVPLASQIGVAGAISVACAVISLFAFGMA